MSLDKLVYMANQIGKFFASQGPEQAVAGTADHIAKFWDPRMRAEIVAHLKAGGAGLDPVARAAVESLPEVKSEVQG
jgi:formate dehydrogenase subunit delta